MITETEKRDIQNFITSATKKKEGTDFVKELVMTPFSDCTMEELCDEICKHIDTKMKNKTQEHNLNVLISDYLMAIKSQRDFEIGILENMLSGASPNYNKGRAYTIYMEEKKRSDLEFKVFHAMMENKQPTDFTRGLSTHALQNVVNNNFDEVFYNVCKVLYKNTNIPDIVAKIENGYNEFKTELENDNQDKATEIAKENDELRETLESFIKTEYDKAILLPCDIEL